MEAILSKGTAIYYTGDMANRSAFGVIDRVWADAYGIKYNVRFENGEKEVITPAHVGLTYEGHCNPRFVTRAAYDAFRG